MKRILSLLFAAFLAFSLVADVFAQRSFGRSGGFGGGRSSFGGGRSSFGGGSFGRSSSGGFFGGSSSSGRTYSGPRSSTGSFGRSGSFGSSGRVNSTSANPSRGYGGGYTRSNPYIYGGRPYYSSGGFWSGYALGSLASPWTYYVPFHPGFYTYRPYYSNGVYHEGGFSFFRFLIGIAVIGLIVWLLVRAFSGGSGGRKYKYTNYR